MKRPFSDCLLMNEIAGSRLDVDQKRGHAAGDGRTLQIERKVCGDADISRYPATQTAPTPVASRAADFQLSC
jgi:hypothetical protein